MINQYIYQYGKRLYGLCLTLCKNSHDAEDLYQDTWLKVLDRLPQYDTSKDFEPWLTSICINTYRDMLRRFTRSPIFNLFTSNEEKTAVLNNAVAPEKEDYSNLHVAIDGLPEKLRITVILFYFRDMDIAATADILGIPTGTVKSRLNKARKLLKEVLTNETDLQF